MNAPVTVLVSIIVLASTAFGGLSTAFGPNDVTAQPAGLTLGNDWYDGVANSLGVADQLTLRHPVSGVSPSSVPQANPLGSNESLSTLSIPSPAAGMLGLFGAGAAVLSRRRR